jgi:hypothetical protein
MKKKTHQTIKNIGIFFLFLLKIFLDETTLMEPLNEGQNNIENLKESWFEWCYKYKFQILLISIILFSLGLAYTDNTPSQLDNLNTLFESLKSITGDELYNFLENMDLKEENLKAVLKVFNKDKLYIEQIKDPVEFQKLIIKLIIELRKK